VRSWWIPLTGGANLPALNDLLASFGIAFGDRVYRAKIHIQPSTPMSPPTGARGPVPNADTTTNNKFIFFASGTTIARFPQNGYLVCAE
jgi:membrane-bound transcription factor site-1 protease